MSIRQRSPKVVVLLTRWFVFVTLLAGAETAAAAPDFYKDKTIRIVVASPVGGTHDLHVRAVARHMAKYVPGSPNLIVQNMPGGGGVVMANYMYNVAKADGLTIGNTLAGNVLLDLVRNPVVQYDSRKFQWIGSITSLGRVCVLREVSGFKTISDVIRSDTPPRVGGSGPGATTVTHPQALNAVLRTKFKVIAGYPGMASIYLAMERGELDGICGADLKGMKVIRPEWFAKGYVRILLQVGVEKDPDLPQVPAAMDLIDNPEDRAFLEALVAPDRMARPLFVPPSVPDERVKLLREAFMKTVDDPAFLKEAEQMRLEISPVSGEKVQSLVERIFAASPAVVKRIAELVN